MSEVTSSELRDAVERQHGGAAQLAGVEPVTETFGGRPVWDGIVHVFDLEGHPTATRAYAWSSPIEGSDERGFYAVLHVRLSRLWLRYGRRSWRITRWGDLHSERHYRYCCLV
jgi:hypothetical protein